MALIVPDSLPSSSFNISSSIGFPASDQLSDGMEIATNTSSIVGFSPIRRLRSSSLPLEPRPIRPLPSLHQSTLIMGDHTPSLKSADSRYFVDLFGRLLALVPRNGEEVGLSCPQCLREEDDPFVGILNEKVLEPICCRLRTYLDLLSSSPVYKTAFTPFGQRLNAVNNLYDVDLRSRLSEHWRRNWVTLGAEGLHRYLRRFVSHIDDDGVTWCFGECSVCYAPCRYVRKPPCCGKAICQLCWTSYVQSVADESFLSVQLTGLYSLHCFACSEFVPYSAALASTETDDLKQIKPPGLLIASKRCPVCLNPAPPIAEPKSSGNGVNNQMALVRKLRQKKGGLPVTCSRCNTTFCSVCSTGNHPKMSCDQLIASDVGFRQWTRQKSSVRPQFPNGRFCPSCHIPVSHGGGCPHMVCPCCSANFCFSCGQRHFQKFLRFLPSHAGSKLVPVVTCPKLWDSQPKRILVHSLVSVGLIFGVAPVAIAVSPIAFPIFFTIYLIKKYKRKRRSS